MPYDIAVPLITVVAISYAVHYAIEYIAHCWYNSPSKKIEDVETTTTFN